MMTDTTDFLAHYGTKGMKWGVRKDRDSSPGRASKLVTAAKSAKANQVKMVNPDELKKREAKAAKFTKEADRLTKLNEGYKAQLPTANVFKKGTYKNMIAENEKLIKTAKADAAAASAGKMTSRQKKLLIGGAVVGGLLVAYGVNQGVQSGAFTRQITKGKAAFEGRDGLFKKKESFANKDYSADDIMKNVVPGINPGYGSWGTNMNCRRATFAYEMRRRGYDVQATKTSNASGQNVLGMKNALSPDQKEVRTGLINATRTLNTNPNSLGDLMNFPAGGKKSIKGTSGKTILDVLSKEPNGSRGEFGVMWKSPVPGIPGGGHSMAYEVINGKAHIFDAQTGKQYKADNKIFKSVESAGYTRLDNLDLNMNYLAKWVR